MLGMSKNVNINHSLKSEKYAFILFVLHKLVAKEKKHGYQMHA